MDLALDSLNIHFFVQPIKSNSHTRNFLEIVYDLFPNTRHELFCLYVLFEEMEKLKKYVLVECSYILCFVPVKDVSQIYDQQCIQQSFEAQVGGMFNLSKQQLTNEL